MSKIKIDAIIILVNWNGWQDTLECVKSCQNLVHHSYQIIIVDNDSQDQPQKTLQQLQRFDNVTLLQSNANLGFAGGNNFGIRHAQQKYNCDYFWLLNNDTVVEQTTLSELIKTARCDSNIGIVGSKIFYYNSSKLWFAGGEFQKHSGYIKHLGMLEEDNVQFSQQKSVDFISGCSLLITKSAIQTVGLIPEDYFLYFEDTDWNFAVKEASFKILYAPHSRVWHKISQSVGQQSTTYYYYMFRNSLIFSKKYFPHLQQRIFLFRCLEIIQLLLKGNFTAVRASTKGIWHFLKKKNGKL
ncbi:glycosyltransferase family 2 protein [Candidatus Uabimicrobium sp. HlEnr_7]|uniref:glycosyltransferase family 2 protein n=1 Tax=Candidatus Uabimicrobium helgolandensis TaxID=3095367 RepID=UPI0035579EB4